MLRNLFVLICFSLGFFAKSQEMVVTTGVKKEKVICLSDTLWIVTAIQSAKHSEQRLDYENSKSYLLKISDLNIDTLISPKDIASESKRNLAEYFTWSLDDMVAESLVHFLDSLGLNEENEDLVEEISQGSGIEHIGAGIFCQTYSTWEYLGGMHGYGTHSSRYYDFKRKSFFEIDDVFTLAGLKYIHQKFVSAVYQDFPDLELTEMAEEELVISSDNYFYHPEHISIGAGMYQTIYGNFEMHYSSFFIEIPYSELKKYIKKNAPISRFIKLTE